MSRGVPGASPASGGSGVGGGSGGGAGSGAGGASATAVAGDRPVLWWEPLAARLLFRVLWPAEIRQADRVPVDGPVIFASNHLGLLDGPLVVGMVPRPTVALIKQEMFRAPFGAIFRVTRQIPVDRSHGDRSALMAALKVLGGGGTIAVFPEGTRGRGDGSEVRQGVAWLALKSGAPIVPVACLGTRRTGEGTSGLPPLRRRLDLVFGEPFTVAAAPGMNGRAALVAATETVRLRLAAHVDAAVALTGQELPNDEPVIDVRFESESVPPASARGGQNPTTQGEPTP